MKRYIKLLLWISGLMWVATLASARQLSGPALGFVWSAGDGKLHPLLGIPGNATIGEARDVGFTITQAFSADGQHFLASSDASPSLLAINAAGATPSITTIAEAPANPSRVAGSRGGTAAALYYAAQQRVLILTGLPAAAKVAWVVDVSVATEGVSRLAISDDGALLLYSVPQGANDALFGWTPLGGYRQLTTADSISAIALTPAGDAIVADARANEIFAILNPKGAATRFFLADDRNGVSSPAGVAVSSAGQIYVANAAGGTILALDAGGQLLRTQQCHCEISGFFPLKDSLYRLSERTDRTLYLLQTATTGERVVFVPPSPRNP